ncbi:MAG TPA: hypothetical protein VEC35_04065 [Noviherbaspirillum sp.]|nr:hypothetical protein [Noviherbaspirillum sp.]
MVFFILTRDGFDELRNSLGRVPSPVWVNKDLLSLDEIEALRKDRVEVTNFVRHIDPFNESAVMDATSTVRNHHPGQHVWVEFASLSNSQFDTDASRRST